MAWKLKFNGAQRVDIPLWTATGRPNSYTIKARFTYNPRTMLMGSNSINDNYILCDNSSRIVFAFQTSNQSLTVPAGVTVGSIIEIEIEANTTQTLGVWYRVFNADRTAVSQTFVSEGAINIDVIGRFFNGLAYTGELFWLSMSNGTDNRFYDANASNGQGTVLIDTLSGRNGTIVGATYVYYNSVENTRSLYPLNIPANTPVSINLNNYFTGATSYAIQSGSLPAGLTLSGNIISGTVAANAASQFTIRASNSIDILDVVTVVQVRSHYLAYNSSSFIHSGYQGKIRFPSWVGSGAANWSVEIDFRITNLSVDSSLMGREGTTGAFTVWASGAIGIRGWVASAGGIIAQGVRYKTKLAREGNVLRIYVKPFDTANYGAAVLTTPVNTGSSTFDILGFSDASSLVIDYFSVSFEGAGASYIESWNENNIPRIGTSWIGSNGNAITLAGTQGARDAWWTPYGQGSGNWYLKFPNSTGNQFNNKSLVQISGINGVLSTVRYTMAETLPAFVSNTARYIFDIRRSINSINQGAGTGWLLQLVNGTFESNGVGNMRINGVARTPAEMFSSSLVVADAVCEFGVNVVPSDGCISFGARFNETEHSYGMAVKSIEIVDAGGTHVIDMSSSGGSGTQFRSTDGAVSVRLFNFPADNSGWRFIPPAVGSSTTVNINATYPAYTGSVTASRTLPVYNTNVSTTYPNYTNITNVTNIIPVRNINISVQYPSYTSTLTATNIKPGLTANIVANYPVYTASVNGNNTKPIKTVQVSTTYSSYTASVLSTNIKPVKTVNINTQYPVYVGSVVATKVVVGYSATINTTYPNYIGSVTNTNSKPIKTLNINTTYPTYSSTVVNTNTKPIKNITVTATYSSYTANVTARAVNTNELSINTTYPKYTSSVICGSVVTERTVTINTTYPKYVGNVVIGDFVNLPYRAGKGAHLVISLGSREVVIKDKSRNVKWRVENARL
jgi:hypothetical protein